MRPAPPVCLVSFFLFVSLPIFARVQVHEPEIRATISAHNVTLRVPVSNDSPSASSGILSIELLDPQDGVVSSAKTSSQLKPGSTTVTLDVQLPVISGSPKSDPLLWYRIRYRLDVEGASQSSGIVSLAAIAPELFALVGAHVENALPGQPYRVRVMTANPVTRRAVSGVQLTGQWQPLGKSEIVRATTNAGGEAELVFDIPANLENAPDIEITAVNRERRQELSFGFDIDNRTTIITSTDKPLYQPGQAFHARALVLRTDKHPLADKNVEFELSDPDNGTVFNDTRTTDDFGIASIDWDLPEFLVLGPYQLRVSLPDNPGCCSSTAKIRISRYDLPNFTVTATADRRYYLPGQNASIDVSAKYLFSKGLTAGSVKLVREEQGSWDSKQRKWVIEESDQQTGTLDHNGLATFKVDLSEEQTALQRDEYLRFKDLDYAVYLTDSSTGRTEQRRFQLRLSVDPIHIYVSGERMIGGRASFYLTASYPDGTPAKCDIGISQELGLHSRSLGRGSAPLARSFLRAVKTNRYGVAKVSDLHLLANEIDDTGSERAYYLLFDAHDAEGVTVSHPDQLWTLPKNYIQVTTDRAIYPEGAPILVSTYAQELQAGNLVLDASRDGVLLWTGKVVLHDHRGFTVVPYSSGFKGEIQVTAYSLETGGESSFDLPQGGRTVLFPHASTLDVIVQTDRTTYKPGDEVTAALRVEMPFGSSSSSALGVVVVDKAVDERLRADQEFGERGHGFWNWDWWFYADTVGGVSLRQLYELDPSQPVPGDLELAAEVLLNERSGRGTIPQLEGNAYDEDTQRLFLGKMEAQWAPLREALSRDHTPATKFPTNRDEFEQTLRGLGVSSAMVDPWGSPYHYSFAADYADYTLKIISAGPDKKLGTSDDMELNLTSPYFLPVGRVIESVVKDTFASSGSFIRDYPALRTALLARGIDLDALHDPWGNRYQYTFEPRDRYYEIVVKSAGPGTKDYQDEIIVWTSTIDYFALVRASIDNALFEHTNSGAAFPRDNTAFDKVLAESGISLHQLVDPWGHAYYVKYSVGSEFGDAISVHYRPDARIQNSIPVTMKLARIQIFSSGPDGKPDTSDDFSVAEYSSVIAEQSGKELTPRAMSSPSTSESGGAISGTITDSAGAVVSGADVSASARGTKEKFTTKTGADGTYLIRNIQAGVYDVDVFATGFRAVRINTVPVHAASTTEVNAELQVGTSMQTVEVTSAAVRVEADNASLAPVKSPPGTRAEVKEATFTPRLRDYFPETLFWSPSLITDSNGRARVKFNLADNITTWKMTVLASNKNGEVGVGEGEFKAFQPFFIEHDPPKVLTVGDVIDLPVVLRNYMTSTQQLTIEMKPAPWFQLLHTGLQQISVPADESSTAVFPFRVTEAVTSGKQQVFASNRTIGDAVEKTITVHPDGLQQASTAVALLRDDSTLALNVPVNVISGSLHARLKIYPDLLAHVTESIEAGLERPYGCGEQTISAAYPSLLLLKYYGASDVVSEKIKEKAKQYLSVGYRNLLNYRTAAGGFSYWTNGSADVALTAYAVRFLTDASPLIDVDPEVLRGAEMWLVAQQSTSGDWTPGRGDNHVGLTAYVAVTFAQAGQKEDERHKKLLHGSLVRALEFLSSGQQDVSDPYTLAEYAIAAKASGAVQQSAVAIAKLEGSAVSERGGVYWALERNTPFYGWGHTGRLESTAMAVLALSETGGDSAESRRLIDQGAIWLLSQQDRYGVWYSGQATVDVLSALLHTVGSTTSQTSNAPIGVSVNGTAMSPEIVGLKSSAAPVIVDISGAVRPGNNTIIVRKDNRSATANIQAVAEYYTPWGAESQTESEAFGSNDVLRMAVTLDKTSVKASEEVRATVSAERIGSRGWGMMIAEVGLPPGVDVDRSTLEAAVAKSDLSLFRYDVLPDRVVLYMWPKAGGTTLRFSFRPRYGMQAYTEPSLLYDYYNPDARVVLRAIDFDVRPATESIPNSVDHRPATLDK